MFKKASYFILSLIISLAPHLKIAAQIDSTIIESIPKKTKKSLFNLERLSNKNISLLALPSITISPETDFKAGILIDYFYKTKGSNTKPRVSSTWGQILYSTRNQLTVSIATNTYTNEERFYISARAGLLVNYERFWGFTSATLNNPDYASVTYNRLFANGSVLKNLGNKTFVGVNFNYSKYYNIATNEKDKISNVTSTDITVNSNVVGLGASFVVDKRNNQFSPTLGKYLEISNTLNYQQSSVYNHLVLDARKYFTQHNRTWALQFYSTHQFGIVPVFDKNRIGGHSLMRGIFQGKYRDNSLWCLQAEYRMPLSGLLKLAFFGSTGNTAPDVNSLFKQQILWSGGSGLRLLINKQKEIYVRADVAYTSIHSFGYYIRIGDAF